MSKRSPFFKLYSCPACNTDYPTLEKLNFHLSYACSSRLANLEASSKKSRSEPEVVQAVSREDEIDLADGAKLTKATTLASLTVLGGNKPKKPSQQIECPGCRKAVDADDLSFHLDTTCSSKASLSRTDLSQGERKPPGLVLLENFITEEEEETLVAFLEAHDDWKPSKRNGKCDTKHWGVVIDYSAAKIRTRHPNPSLGEKELPDEFRVIIERFAKYPPLSAWWPNEANANRYLKDHAHYLTPHFDDRQLSGEIICNVSLLADCIMTFAKPGSAAAPFRVRLPRFCASVMSRSSRYDFTHAITNDDLLGQKRISLNFRQQAAPLTGKPLNNTTNE